ncbi:MAG: 2-dehydropantoate 2-reductase [Actinomycetota bacterium]|nr:2-dehydropantoate 2-reductase [Actinomycetota bacterium]
MARVAVVGPGSVGLFFAGHLAAAGHDVVSCARRPFDRYVIESETAPLDVPARVATDPSELTDDERDVDWVFVAVKAHQTVGASGWFEPLCGPSTVVVSVQNGVEDVERLTPLVGGAEVLGSVVYCGAQLAEPGRIRHTSSGFLIVDDTDHGRAAAALLGESPAQIRPSERYVTELWRKLGLNVAANGITALTGKSMEVLDRPDAAELARGLLDECWTVARAEGADLGDDDIERFLAAPKPAGGMTSMLADRRADRPTEYDALHGAVVRIGRRHGIATPRHEVMVALLAAGDPEG